MNNIDKNLNLIVEEIINEEIYGNLGTVYHCSQNKPEDITKWLETGIWKSGSGAGNLYGPGLYTVFNFNSHNTDYGDNIYKFHVKGIKNFFIFLPDVYNKVWNKNFNYDQIIDEQNKRFGLNVDSYKDFVGSHSKLHSKVAGIVFHGNHDGDVCIIFEPRNAIPMSYSSNGGKTWQKLNMSKNYKSNAFKKGGEIVNYMKDIISELKKYEVGKFETINTKGIDEFEEDIYKIRELNISAEQLNKFLEKNSGENYYDAYGDKQKVIAFSIYNNKNPIAIAYFSRYNSNSLHFTAIGQGDSTTTSRDFTKAILKKFNKDKEFKNIFIRYLERKKKREEKDAWQDETMTFKGPQPYIFDRLPIPKPLNYFFKPITMDVEKNAYDNTNKFIGFIKYKFNSNGQFNDDDEFGEFVPDDIDEQFKKIAKQIGKSEHDLSGQNGAIFVLDLSTEAVSSMKDNQSAEAIARYFESRMKPILPAIRSKFKKLIRSKDLETKEDKFNSTKAKASRERVERWQQGKYIGRNQYKMLEQVNYFPY